MKIEFEGETLEFDLEDITVQQAVFLKRRMGLTLLGLDKGLVEGDPDALLAVYWLIRTMSGEKNLDIDNMDFKIVKFANAIQEAVEKEEAEQRQNGEAPKEGKAAKPQTTT